MSERRPSSAECRVGTIGFGYADWREVFYPKSLKPGDYLGFYARHFNAVEIDSTFHAAPPPERFEKWAGAVGDGFRFTIKTPRAITHEAVIGDTIAPMRSFLDAARRLGSKLGVVLIQYPPALPARVWPQLARFLDALPSDIRFAVEFRHDSWFNDQIFDALKQRRIALVNAEYDAPPAREPVFTTDFAYIRLVGRHGRFEPMTHERFDPTEKLAWWNQRIAPPGPMTRYILIGNDFAGYAIGTADRLLGMLGQRVATPAERMGMLF